MFKIDLNPYIIFINIIMISIKDFTIIDNLYPLANYIECECECEYKTHSDNTFLFINKPKRLPRLKKIKTYSLPNLISICNHHSHITELIITFPIHILLPILSFKKLKSLQLNKENTITDLSPLSHLQHLTHLNLYGSSDLTSLDSFTSLTSLTHLKLYGGSNVKELNPLTKMTNLIHITIRGGYRFQNLNHFDQLIRLEYLNLAYAMSHSFGKDPNDFKPLYHLPNLHHLDLSGCTYTHLHKLNFKKNSTTL